MIVIDASVFNKLFLDEDDRQDAIELFEYCIENDIEIIAPDILPYEAMSAAIRFSVPFEAVFRILAIQRSAGLRLISPSLQVMNLAEKIASTGHAKSGYPDVYDSIYHALALDRLGTFMTADRRHFSKTKQFGGVELLADWQRAVSV
jgi:predicted nucleic acid-binding protein